MAITIREQQDAGTQVAANTFTLGAGTQTGDLIIAVTGSDFFAMQGVSMIPTGTAVAKWILRGVVDQDYDNSAQRAHLVVWSGVCTTGGASTVITHAGTAGEEMYHGVMVLAGPNAVFDCCEGNLVSAASVNAIAPSLTPRFGRTDNLLVCVWTNGTQGLVNYTVPGSMTGYTERDVATFATYRMAREVWASSAATGTRTATSASVANQCGISFLVGNNSADTARTSTAITPIAATTWVAPASSTTIAPTYPGGLATGDIVYMIIVSKPGISIPTVPASWEWVQGRSGGSIATQAADVGATRIDVFRRIVPGGGLSGTQSVTITGGSALVGTMCAFNASGTNLVWELGAAVTWNITAASTTIGGTANSDLEIAANDYVEIVLVTPTDAATTLTLTGLTATGATIGTLTRDPNATVINAQGNDISATSYRAPITAGASTAALVATATSNVSATAMGLVLRVRATVDVALAESTLPLYRPEAVHRSHYW